MSECEQWVPQVVLALLTDSHALSGLHKGLKEEGEEVGRNVIPAGGGVADVG